MFDFCSKLGGGGLQVVCYEYLGSGSLLYLNLTFLVSNQGECIETFLDGLVRQEECNLVQWGSDASNWAILQFYHTTLFGS